MRNKLIVAMAICCLITITAFASSTGFFNDIRGHWAENEINTLAEAGIIKGFAHGDGTYDFEPQRTVTRAEFLAMMAEMSRETLSKWQGTNDHAIYFIDVSATDWFGEYVVWAYQNRITVGFEDPTFRPGMTITRQEMAVFLDRFAATEGLTLPAAPSIAFRDEAQISSWAISAVRSMQYAGVMKGHDYGLFAPLDNATRAEAATLINNFRNMLIESQQANRQSDN